MEVELLDDVAAVRLDGVDADDELLGDLAVRVAAGDEAEDLALAVGEAVVVKAVLAAGADAADVVVQQVTGD